MPAKLPPYLVAKGKHGGPPYYWQPGAKLRAAGWRPRRLPDELPAAIAAAAAVNAEVAGAATAAPNPVRGRSAVAPGTVLQIAELWQRSAEWSELAPKTQRSYRQCLDILCAWCGDVRPDAVTIEMAQAWYRQRRDGTPARKGKPAVPGRPAQANACVRVARILWGWAAGKGWAVRNPWRTSDAGAGVKIKGTARGGSRDLWSPAALDVFVAAADAAGLASLGTACIANAWLGQREADILGLTWSLYRDGALRVTQRKTGAVVDLPLDLVASLSARLADELARQRAAGIASTHILVCESTSRPWQPDHFRHAFARIRQAATAAHPELADELARMTFQRFRAYAVTRLAEAGATSEQIAAITGHTLTSVNQILEHYLVRTRALATAAFKRRLEHEESGRK